MPPDRRNTRQRSAIRDAIEAADGPLSPAEVHEAARADVPNIGLATVYRTINSLLEDGVIAAVELPGEPARYEAAGRGHHHHFRCTACHRVYDFTGCPGNLAQLAPEGFKVTGHDIVLYGVCVDCR